MNCPNKNHPDWKELVNKIGVNNAYLEFYKNGMDIPNPSNYQDTFKGVNASLNILDKLSSPEGQRLFNRFFATNKDKFYNELTQLAGKQQVDLLRNAITTYNLSSMEDIISFIASEMAYTIEIETALSYEKGKYSPDYYKIVPTGGVNYFENRIKLPLVFPTRLTDEDWYHDFNSEEDIGWFRADEVDSNREIRRILEIQSHIFQKGRSLDRFSLTPREDDFMKVLNKNNNWVDVFLKSVIQDSYKKGYKAIRIPTGDTTDSFQVIDTPETYRDALENSIARDREMIKDLEEKISRGEVPPSGSSTSGFYATTPYPVRLESIKKFLERDEKELAKLNRGETTSYTYVYDFYQKVVPTILRKQGYEVNLVTDNYNNTWNEITIGERSGQEFYFSINPSERTEWEKESYNRLKQTIVNFLKANNISYEEVSSITDKQGNKLDAFAIADLTTKSVRVLQGQDSPEILGEEAGHFLVELLGENSPLYQSMYNEITNYNIYNRVLEQYGGLQSYKANEKKLRKEAIGQLIGQIIAGNVEENQQRTERVDRWWNRVLRFLKERIKGLLGIESVESAILEYDPFSEAAQIILSERRLENSDFLPVDDYYLATEDLQKQKKVVNDILNKHKVIQKDKTYYLVKDGVETKIEKRVTDRVKAWGAGKFAPRGEMEQKIDELKAKYGTSGHQDIQNIIDRAIARRKGTIEPTRQHSLPEDLYNTLERHFNKFIESFPQDAEFITENTLFDPSEKEAGTVDLIVVYNDGSASIYDWKFIDFGKKKEIAWYKEQGFNIQLPRYKEILRKEYGVERFRQTRVIPISARYKSGKLVGLEMADVTIKDIPESQEYLRPLPIYEEMTGDEGLDKILESLLNEKSRVENSKPKSNSSVTEIDEFRAKKKHDLQRIQKAIRDIQVKHDLTEYVDRGIQLIKDLNASDLKTIDSQELLNLINTKLDFYGHDLIGIIERTDVEKSDEIKDKIKTLQANAQVFEERILGELTSRAVTKFGEEIIDPQKETGIWTKQFRTISQQNDPIIASFYDLVRRSTDRTRKEYEELSTKIDAAIADLRREFPGKLGNSLYDFMLNESKNGSLTIIGKYSADFYSKLENNRAILKDSSSSKENKAKAREWIRKNTKFDEEGFKKRRETFKAAMERAYKEYSNSKELIDKRLTEYDDKWSNNDFGLANPRNRNISVVDNPINYSEKYKAIANNKAMKNFYDLWMEASNQFQDYVGIDKGRNFVWNVPNSLFESMMQNGIGSVINKQVLLERFYAREGEELGMIDPDTGKPLMKIPVYFSRQNMVQDKNGEWRVDSTNQSRDLGSVLLTVGAMAYNHKNMSDIETDAHLLYTVMAHRPTIATGSQGNVLRNKLTGAIQKMINSSSTLEQFQDYIDHYLYGKNLKHGDFVFGKGKQKYSGMAVYNAVAKTFVGKALAFNPVSIVSNAVAGTFSATMVGRSRMFFNNKDYSNAMFNLIPMRDKKTHTLIGYFDLIDGENYRHKSNNRNINWLTRKLTYDNLFIGQKGGDWIIRNSILIGMSKKYKVEEGKIVRVAKNENSPTLYDYIDTNGNDLNLKDLDQVELDRFRDKVHAVANNVLGNSTNNDIRLINMTVGGRALMMFRSWLPRTFDSRYGELRYNRELEVYELGRYRSFFNQVINKQVFPLIGEMIAATGVFGFGGKVGRTTIERAKELWAEAVQKDPTLKITQEEYVELHVANIRMMMAELYTLLSIIGMVMLVAPDDDETLEQGSLRKYLNIQLGRIQSEIMTYWNPIEFDNIMRNPIPMTRVVLDAKNFAVSLVETPYLAATGQKDLIKPGDLRKYTFKMIPGLSGFEQIWSFIDQNYDKTQAQIDKAD